jgi:PII-like signaling protein
MMENFEAFMLRVHIGESDRWSGRPLYEAILAACQDVGISVAMAYRGIEGYGTSSRIRHARPWPFSRDAPIMLSIIGTEDNINKLMPYLDEMVSEGLVARSRVRVTRFAAETDRTSV